MAKKLLIDATHAEETRVVVLDGNKVEEFDFETIHKRQLAGNIYLAKVTRVEPSLQAAFVDYGGNRHGFLAFAEIHPDYYQIPVADRQALLAEERALAAREDEDSPRRPRRRRDEARDDSRDEAKSEDTKSEDVADHLADGQDAADAVTLQGDAPDGDAVTEAAAENGDEGAPQAPAAQPVAAQAEGTDLRSYGAMDVIDLDDGDTAEEHDSQRAPHAEEGNRPYRAADHASEIDDQIESVADEDVSDEVRPPRRSRARRYKIQEVIKVRQIMLVQVVKEERGNKGAALTTYLSLAGRYCVLMPNTARGGGISRKITNAADRKKLKEIAGEFDVPEGAGLIIRTAGANRTKAEIKRDYEYLFRVWEQIRELTLKSIAPAPIYEEGNLIKRSIRDLYNKDIDEVLVEGEGGYRTAKDFMKMIMPSHAKNVKFYTEAMPLFARYQAESYLGQMFNPTVQLKSGGYIVIGVTEALVAIDVNSGKSTREGSIEDTALKTNLEAADEIARQLRLRDLAGLIVIDFIDMEERKNNASVEKRLKEALRNDRARIQVGRISGFGLLEMSRQRLRPGMIEATTQPCPHCHGTGLIRSDNSLALQILRALEEEGTRNRSKEVLVKAPIGIVNYLFNSKREHLAQIEARYGMAIRIEADPSLISPDYTIEKFKTATRIVSAPAPQVVSLDAQTMSDIDEELADEIEDDTDTDTDADTEAEAEAPETATSDDSAEEKSDGGKRKRRRRRRRRGGQNGDGPAEGGADDATDDAEGEDDAAEAVTEGPAAETAADSSVAASVEADAETAVATDSDAEKPAKKRRTRTRKPKAAEAGADPVEAAAAPAEVEAAPLEATADEVAAPKKRTRARRKPKVEDAPAAAAPEGTVDVAGDAPTAQPAAEPAAQAPEAIAAPAPQPEEPAVPEPVPAPVPEVVVTPEPQPEPQPEPHPEPQPEPVAVADAAPEPQPEPAPEADASKPRRSGWWARKS